MLPPWVIVHGARKSHEGGHLYLGPHGWTAQRIGALSFDDEGAAKSWLADSSTKNAKPVKVEHKANTDDNGAPRTLADYEPI